MDMEDLLNECGGFGKFQILMLFGIYSHKLTTGWSMLQMSFAGFIPDWHCVLGQDTANLSHYAANETLKQCSLNASYYQKHTSYFTTNDSDSYSIEYRTQDCSYHRFEGSSSTAITEWDLVCDRKWIKATITSIQMAGVLVGAASSGQLADTFGRKKITYGFSLLHALLNFGAAFSNSWEMFAGFRFFIGIGIGAILVVTFPYPMEFLPIKWRPVLAILPVWALGVSVFSITAMFVDDWSYLHIACGAFGLPAQVGYFYLPESVRWLTLKGRYDEAEKVFEQIATINGKTKPKHTRAVLEEVYKQEQESRNKGREYTYWDLFKGKQQLISTLIFSYIWFALSAVYYGISFGVSALSGNLYLNIFLLAIVEIPPQLSTFYLNNIFGRKWTCIGLLIIGTIPACGCWIVYSLVDADSRGGWITGLSLTSKMGLGAAWGVTSTWVSESYPTVVRSLGYGVVNTAARVGGILAPFVIDLDNEPLSAYAIITSMVIATIILSLFVPDTKGKLLADSLGKSSPSSPLPSSTKDNDAKTLTDVHTTPSPNSSLKASITPDTNGDIQMSVINGKGTKGKGEKFAVENTGRDLEKGENQ